MQSITQKVIQDYEDRQKMLEPFLACSAAASTVYEQMEIQKAYIENIDIDDISNLTLDAMEVLTEKLKIIQDTTAKIDRLLEVLSANSSKELTP